MLNAAPTRALAGLLAAVSLATVTHAAPGPGDREQMLRKLIQDAAQGRVAYETLTPGLAEAVRPQMGVAQSELSALGPLKSITLQSTGKKDGMQIYRTVFEKGALDWAFHVDDHGLIDNAAYRPAKAAP